MTSLPKESALFAESGEMSAVWTRPNGSGMAHWSMGYLLMQRNVADYQSLFVRGRSMIIVLALGLGWLVYRWATELYGRAAGLVALGMFAFSPDLLAHGHLVTLDLAGALGFTVTAYATWRMLERETYSALANEVAEQVFAGIDCAEIRAKQGRETTDVRQRGDERFAVRIRWDCRDLNVDVQDEAGRLGHFAAPRPECCGDGAT